MRNPVSRAAAPMHVDPASTFDPDRVHVRRYGDRLLVIDRANGRWIGLDHREGRMLPLLKLGPGVIAHAAIGARLEELRQLLVDNDIGVSDGADPTRLNTIILKLTKRCNIACAYCYDFENGDQARNADAGQMKAAVTQALDLAGVGNKLSVILHGGEPMLVWDLLEEIVAHGEAEAARLGVRIGFQGQTNMTALTARKVAFSQAHDIAWGISLDGDAAANDRFRIRTDAGGTYNLFERALRDYGDFVRQFPVLSTITGPTSGRLLETARHFRDIGMAGWDWSLFQPIGRARNGDPQFEANGEQLLASWAALFAAVEAGEFDGFPVQPVLKYLRNFIEGPGGNMCLRPKCGAARDLVSVSYDGAIEACDCLDRNGPLSPIGAMETGDLRSARSGALSAFIRSRDTSRNHCSQCLWFGQCGGTCLAHSGGIDTVNGLHCAVSQLAFDSIARSMLTTPAMQRYYGSCQ